LRKRTDNNMYLFDLTKMLFVLLITAAATTCLRTRAKIETKSGDTRRATADARGNSCRAKRGTPLAPAEREVGGHDMTTATHSRTRFNDDNKNNCQVIIIIVVVV